MRRLALATFALAFLLRPGTTEAAPRHRVVLISVDGLMPASYVRPDELGLRVPNLRKLAAAGAWARGVQGVLPTVTYPSHTTLVTGVPPRVHGIPSNRVFDPEGLSNEAWHWYASEIRVPSLVTTARARGLTTATVAWPVTVGLAADHNFPEVWRSGSTHASDLRWLDAVTTPGLRRAVELGRGKPFSYPLTDDDRLDTALHLLRTERPELLLLHLIDVDHEQHDHGPGSPEAAKAIEATDARIGRLLAVLEETGLAAETWVAVVSDHGFEPLAQELRPNVLLARAGLLTVGPDGKVVDWQAFFHADGGSAALRLKTPDPALLRRIEALLAPYLADPAEGLQAVLGPAEIERLGGSAEATLVLDARSGFAFGKPATGPWRGPATDRGAHGHAPDRPALHASLILAGPQLPRRGDLGIVPMTQIAPTLAAWLGLTLAPEAARVLPGFDPSPARQKTD